MARPRTYTLDEKYFDKIDSQNKAYILGFIYADGSINKGCLNITLSNKDVEILEFIKSELKYSGKITLIKIKENDYCRLCICSKEMCRKLNDLGIISNKTYDSVSLPLTPFKYYNDMLRGFFDGDGSIYSNNKKGYTVAFSSNIHILKIIKNYLQKIDIKSSNIRLRYPDSIYSGSIEMRGNNQILKFIDLIYKDNNFCLKRKHDRFVEFKEYINGLGRRNLSPETITLIKNNYLEGVTQKEIHLKLNLPFSTVRTVINRLRKNKEIK